MWESKSPATSPPPPRSLRNVLEQCWILLVLFEAFAVNACLNTNQKTSYSSHGIPSFKAPVTVPLGVMWPPCLPVPARQRVRSRVSALRRAAVTATVLQRAPLPALPQGMLSSLENQNIRVATGKSPLLSRPLSCGAMPSLFLVSDLESGPIQSGSSKNFKQATILNVNRVLRPSALRGSVSHLE